VTDAEYINRMRRRVEVANLERRIAAAVRALPVGRYLLAVSGGRDSMVLMDSFARWRSDICAVATFDHGTGEAATQAALLVELAAERRGLATVIGSRTAAANDSEADWRAARRSFLLGWARQMRATVVTAHTRDDQLETVVMRTLRGSGARGLAGMYAPSAVVRPLLGITRGEITRYAASCELCFLDDPSNVSRAHLRNRVRLDLLPALERAAPGFGASMLALSVRAAELRAGVEHAVDALGIIETAGPYEGGTIAVQASAFAGLDVDAIGTLWPAIAARVGVALDWRGTRRLVAFTIEGKRGGRIPLSGGVEVLRTPTTFVVKIPLSVPLLYSFE
jgi:tRNA(Ile)-lysidine synthase